MNSSGTTKQKVFSNSRQTTIFCEANPFTSDFCNLELTDIQFTSIKKILTSGPGGPNGPWDPGSPVFPLKKNPKH